MGGRTLSSERSKRSRARRGEEGRERERWNDEWRGGQTRRRGEDRERKRRRMRGGLRGETREGRDVAVVH